jgi:hypothetical protein
MSTLDDLWNDTMYAYQNGELSREQVALKFAEALKPSHNKPMPKLPTLAECQTEIQSQIWGGGFKGTSSNITEIVYNFICRQLSA